VVDTPWILRSLTSFPRRFHGHHAPRVAPQTRIWIQGFSPIAASYIITLPLSTRFFCVLNRLYSCYSDGKLTFHYSLSSESTLSYSLRKLVHITRFKPLTIIQNESYLRGRYENTCSPRNDGPLQEGAVLTACDSLFFFFFLYLGQGSSLCFKPFQCASNKFQEFVFSCRGVEAWPLSVTSPISMSSNMSAMPNFFESSALMLFLYSLILTSTKPETKLSISNRR
jgi:hypothetical protein